MVFDVKKMDGEIVKLGSYQYEFHEEKKNSLWKDKLKKVN